jgi:holo-[acyl-carrier protein] synthase
MILGTGTDITEVPRVARAIARFGERFLERVFTPREIAYCQSKKNAVERFAARFAAKEAGMKAIGTGLRQGVTWQDVEVGREPGGRPTIHYHRRAREHFDRLGAHRAHLSLTHTGEMAFAIVVIED